eukprot:6196005-Pleurochrysis_carterae.AAC.3
MVGGENFSLARPHGGDTIVRARLDREWWLRANVAAGMRVRLAVANPADFAGRRGCGRSLTRRNAVMVDEGEICQLALFRVGVLETKLLAARVGGGDKRELQLIETSTAELVGELRPWINEMRRGAQSRDVHLLRGDDFNTLLFFCSLRAMRK